MGHGQTWLVGSARPSLHPLPEREREKRAVPFALFTLLMFLNSSVAIAQSTQPAPASTPKEALTRLSAALHDGDASAIVALIDVPSGPAGKVAKAMARFDAGLADLHRAATMEFGKEKGSAVIGEDDAAAELSQSAIDSAEVHIDGNHATVTYTNPDQQYASLIKTDQGWKIKLNELDAIDLTNNADSSAQLFDDLTATARKLAEEIRQHKLKNADKAAEAWHNRMMQAVSDTQPATQESP
jgi:hypothetical protein